MFLLFLSDNHLEWDSLPLTILELGRHLRISFVGHLRLDAMIPEMSTQTHSISAHVLLTRDHIHLSLHCSHILPL